MKNPKKYLFTYIPSNGFWAVFTDVTRFRMHSCPDKLVVMATYVRAGPQWQNYKEGDPVQYTGTHEEEVEFRWYNTLDAIHLGELGRMI